MSVWRRKPCTAVHRCAGCSRRRGAMWRPTRRAHSCSAARPPPPRRVSVPRVHCNRELTRTRSGGWRAARHLREHDPSGGLRAAACTHAAHDGHRLRRGERRMCVRGGVCMVCRRSALAPQEDGDCWGVSESVTQARWRLAGECASRVRASRVRSCVEWEGAGGVGSLARLYPEGYRRQPRPRYVQQCPAGALVVVLLVEGTTSADLWIWLHRCGCMRCYGVLRMT